MLVTTKKKSRGIYWIFFCFCADFNSLSFLPFSPSCVIYYFTLQIMLARYIEHIYTFLFIILLCIFLPIWTQFPIGNIIRTSSQPTFYTAITILNDRYNRFISKSTFETLICVCVVVCFMHMHVVSFDCKFIRYTLSLSPSFPLSPSPRLSRQTVRHWVRFKQQQQQLSFSLSHVPPAPLQPSSQIIN